jgi:hypothetical protein
MLVEVFKWCAVEKSALFLQQEKEEVGQRGWENDFRNDEGTNGLQGNVVKL